MAITIIIVILSLIGLITLHELGHFVLARFFKVRVEEFGIFLPPRIWGKQVGETIYSLNLIPLGAFVRLHGEEGKAEGSCSFTSKPVWQRALIVAGGVISFWLIAIIIFSYVFSAGAVQVVADTESISGAQVQIVGISANSPAFQAGIMPSDIVTGLQLKSNPAESVSIDKVAQIQDFTAAHKGEEVVFKVQRGAEALDMIVVPRVDPPAGEGSVGVSLVRTAEKSYVWWQAIGKSVTTCWDLTVGVFSSWGQVIGRLAKNEGLPPGAQLVGPIGIASLMNQAAGMGVNYYLQFVAIISVYLAIFNALPIPALDGGKLVFLAIEAVRRKPVSEKIEQTVTAAFMFILLAIFVFATIGDISRLF